MEEPPQFKRSLKDVNVIVGTGTKFLVEISSSSDLKVAWYHNGSLVKDSSRLVLLQDRGIYCVQISEVIPADEGNWICKAQNNSSGQISESSCVLQTQIPALFKPPEFVKGLRGCLWDNGTLSLECEVMGVPTPMLRWYRDAKQLLPGSSLSVKANSKESKSFIGLFACEAENCMGSKAIFSKVYARNFPQYLKQFRESNGKSNNSLINSNADRGIVSNSN